MRAIILKGPSAGNRLFGLFDWNTSLFFFFFCYLCCCWIKREVSEASARYNFEVKLLLTGTTLGGLIIGWSKQNVWCTQTCKQVAAL